MPVNGKSAKRVYDNLLPRLVIARETRTTPIHCPRPTRLRARKYYDCRFSAVFARQLTGFGRRAMCPIRTRPLLSNEQRIQSERTKIVRLNSLRSPIYKIRRCPSYHRTKINGNRIFVSNKTSTYLINDQLRYTRATSSCLN